MMTIDIARWRTIKGFMHEEEAQRLYDISLDASLKGPILEIGSYCGKSAFVIGSACEKNDSILFSIDHHKGSEEQQPGEEYHDPDLFDSRLKRVNTLPFLQQTLSAAGLDDIVIPVVGSSAQVGRFWQTQLSMVFIDGGHSYETALSDYRTWAKQIMPDGYLVFHDIFLNPEEGGQAPRQVYDLACQSNDFQVLEMTNTLGVLKKK